MVYSDLCPGQLVLAGLSCLENYATEVSVLWRVCLVGQCKSAAGSSSHLASETPLIVRLLLPPRKSILPSNSTWLCAYDETCDPRRKLDWMVLFLVPMGSRHSCCTKIRTVHTTALSGPRSSDAIRLLTCR